MNKFSISSHYMSEAESPQGQEPGRLPFSNLYLISGLVHGYNKLYMYLVTILFLISGYVGGQMLVAYPLYERLQERGYDKYEIAETPNLLFNAGALGMDRNLVLTMIFLMFIGGFVGFYIGLRRLHEKTLASVLTGFERFRFRRFWLAFTVWGSLIGLLICIAYFSGTDGMSVVFDPRRFLLSALVLCLFMPVQVLFEEVIFRGYLMQGLSQVFRNGIVPLVLTSLLFGLAHMSNPEVARHGWALMLPYYCANALFLGLLTLLDEGLELAIGIHLANNLVSGLLISTPNSVLQPYTVFMVPDENPGAELLAWFVMAGIAFAAFYYSYRWKNFTLVIR